MTLSETPRFMTPRVSIYDLLSATEYRGPINSTKLLISRSENFTQIFAFSPILDLKDSTVSLRCRPSGENWFFSPFSFQIAIST